MFHGLRIVVVVVFRICYYQDRLSDKLDEFLNQALAISIRTFESVRDFRCSILYVFCFFSFNDFSHGLLLRTDQLTFQQSCLKFFKTIITETPTIMTIGKSTLKELFEQQQQTLISSTCFQIINNTGRERLRNLYFSKFHLCTEIVNTLAKLMDFCNTFMESNQLQITRVCQNIFLKPMNKIFTQTS